MANDRRVIYGAHVVPQEEIVREEGLTTYKLDATVAKRFGGKGSVTVASDQVNDQWTSMFHPDLNWEDHATATDDVWQNQYTCWDGTLSIANGATKVIRDQDTVNIDFMYVKNTGSSNEIKLALEGNEYDILIPAGASVAMRVNDISSANIKADTTSGTTTIEYIIAKTS